MNGRIQPELLDQLKRSDDSPVQAVVQLRSAREPDEIPSPEESGRLANEVLGRVTAEVGHGAIRTNVLRNIASLIVEADRQFLQSLIRQPEVISAAANVTKESPFIPPKNKRRA